MRIAVCSGSFDPITLGHMDIIRRTAACFDQVYVCVSPNAEKRGQMFTPEQKLKLVEAAVLELPNVTAEPYGETEREMKSLIAEQTCSAVQWQSTIERMIRDGASIFIETGEGKVLSGLIRKIDKSVKVLHYSEVLANGGSL